jgi:hypothetical protein
MLARLTYGRWLTACALVIAVPVFTRADVTALSRAHLRATDVEPLASGNASDAETLGYPFTAELIVRVHRVFSTDTVAVLLNDELLGTISLTDGDGKLKLQGHLGEVPFINPGDVIDIVNADDGTLLLEGIFD